MPGADPAPPHKLWAIGLGLLHPARRYRRRRNLDWAPRPLGFRGWPRPCRFTRPCFFGARAGALLAALPLDTVPNDEPAECSHDRRGYPRIPVRQVRPEDAADRGPNDRARAYSLMRLPPRMGRGMTVTMPVLRSTVLVLPTMTTAGVLMPVMAGPMPALVFVRVCVMSRSVARTMTARVMPMTIPAQLPIAIEMPRHRVVPISAMMHVVSTASVAVGNPQRGMRQAIARITHRNPLGPGHLRTMGTRYGSDEHEPDRGTDSCEPGRAGAGNDRRATHFKPPSRAKPGGQEVESLCAAT